MNNPDISLIFVNFRSVYQLSLALRRLFSVERDRSLYEVIVVNNDVSEETTLRILSAKIGFSLITLPSNIGFGAAVNVGVKSARGRFLGFLNPDTLWQKHILSDVVAYFQARDRECLLGMTLLDERGQVDHQSSGIAPHFGQLIWSNVFPFHTNQSHRALDWVSGGGLFLRQPLFESLGGFDERFFLYFEDVDLCLRARARGVSVVAEPQFTLLHRGGKSFSSRKAQKTYFYASQQAYYAKHRSWWESMLLRCLHFIFHSS